MPDRGLLLRTCVMVVASASIAYGLVFWTPWFGGRRDFGYGDYYGSSYDYSYDTFVPDRVIELAKLQPQEFQELVQSLFDELIKLPEAQLYMLNAAGDEVCLSTLINCQGVPGKNVKPFVEKALAHKQATETIAISSGSLATARLSLAISFAAFLVSVAGLFLKRKSS